MNTTLVLNKQDIIYCNSFFKRLKGMLFSKYNGNKVYCFPKCISIHTFFMTRNIDIVITDKDNNVIKIIQDLKPWKIIFPIKKGYFTYEFEAKFIHNIKNIKKIRVNL